jgi:PleD family two-component response regulator
MRRKTFGRQSVTLAAVGDGPERETRRKEARAARVTPSSDEPVVYIVDDDEAVREATRDLLSSVGLRVECFGTAQEFLGSSRPDAPACLILDVRMPGPSGLDLQRELA